MTNEIAAIEQYRTIVSRDLPSLEAIDACADLDIDCDTILFVRWLAVNGRISG